MRNQAPRRRFAMLAACAVATITGCSGDGEWETAPSVTGRVAAQATGTGGLGTCSAIPGFSNLMSCGGALYQITPTGQIQPIYISSNGTVVGASPATLQQLCQYYLQNLNSFSGSSLAPAQAVLSSSCSGDAGPNAGADSSTAPSSGSSDAATDSPSETYCDVCGCDDGTCPTDSLGDCNDGTNCGGVTSAELSSARALQPQPSADDGSVENSDSATGNGTVGGGAPDGGTNALDGAPMPPHALLYQSFDYAVPIDGGGGGVTTIGITFTHGAGEMIYTKPNGFMSFDLFNAQGNVQDMAPSDVAVQTGNAAAVTSPLDCMSCHGTAP
jgi:hypothetical protein